MSLLTIPAELLAVIYFIIVHILKEIYYVIFRNRPRKKITSESILITGAAQGMGAVYARRFAEMGNIIHCVDIQKKLNEESVEKLRKNGYKAYAYTCDITEWDALQDLKAQVEANSKPVSYLINNAGICMGRSLIDLTPTQIQRTLNVNLLSQFFVTKTFLPNMLAQSHGHILNMVSTAGYLAGKQVTDYCASKFGSVGFSECLLEELAGTGVHCTFVCPFYTTSGMFEGLAVRFKWMFPPLDMEYVVGSAITAIEENQAMVMAPFMFWILVGFKGITPRAIFDNVCRFLGRDEIMTQFVGRGTAEKIK